MFAVFWWDKERRRVNNLDIDRRKLRGSLVSGRIPSLGHLPLEVHTIVRAARVFYAPPSA